MANNIILTIQKQGHQGDGIGYYNGKKVIVPFAATGDVLDVKFLNENNKYIKAEINEIIKPSFNRIAPLCKYFTICGGCSMQHLDKNIYQTTKSDFVGTSIKRAGFNYKKIDFISPVNNLRRKIRIHVKNNKIGFYKRNSHEIIEIEECKIISEDMLNEIKNLRKGNLRDQDIDITTIKNDHIKIGNYLIKYNNYFIQAFEKTNEIIANLIEKNLKESDNIIDLFSGIGAYSLLLHNKVSFMHAFDNDERILKNINEVIRKYNIQNIKFNLRNLYDNPINSEELNKFDVIIINPPKSGAENQFKEIANSKINFIHIISCNPITLERDLKYLKNNGYKLKNVCIIDQFKWSHHVETYLYLEKTS